jgi:hypothetical protein
MPKAKIINKTLKLPLLDIIKYQINMHCFLNEIRVSPAQLNCLGLLGLYGEINMSDFCGEVVSEEIFGNVQTTRNFITKCVKSKTVIRKGLGNKNICLHPDLQIQCEGTIVLTLKLFHLETN